jgi:hypothetical protein
VDFPFIAILWINHPGIQKFLLFLWVFQLNTKIRRKHNIYFPANIPSCMTKLIRSFVFVVLLSATAMSYGQSSVGVFAGLNSSKLSGDIPKKADYKGLMGLNAGAFFDLKLSRTISLSLQPSYSQEGTKITYSMAGLDEPVDSMLIR